MLVAALGLGGCRSELPPTPLFAGLPEASARNEDAGDILKARLLERFPLGAQDRPLADFLRDQGFKVDRRRAPLNRANPFIGHAKQYFGPPLSGKTLVSVHWRANAQGQITEVTTWYGGAL